MAQKHQRMIEKIEYLSARAIPCIEREPLSGWELRFAGGLTRRTNSVNVVTECEENIDLADKISHCEQVYQNRGRPCHFRITPLAMEIGLDAALAERGYEIFDPTAIRLLDLKGRTYSQDTKVQISRAQTVPWLKDVALLTHQSPQQQQAFTDMIARISGHKICAHVRQGGKAVACALGVAEQDMVGIFELATAQSARRRGIGKSMIETLLNEAKSASATTAYLQVVHDNKSGNGFWDRLGFSAPLYSYHYRSKPD